MYEYYIFVITFQLFLVSIYKQDYFVIARELQYSLKEEYYLNVSFY